MLLIDQETREQALRSQILLYHSTATMTDRERAAALGLPEGCRIREGAKILCPEKFQCGHHVWIGEGAMLDAQGGLTIGDYTQIGLNAMVWSHSSISQAQHAETAVSSRRITYTPTKIGARCFIGGPSVIYPGVTIGDGAVVLPMSVVDRDVPVRGWVTDNRDFRKYESRIEELEARVKELESKLRP
jgi:acetyltransferase-like isoleucine patch superfamily enzyme